jgi:hypothetical protein
MTLRTTLFSGIAGLALASALSFGAYAQAVTPTAAPQVTNPGQTPATAPSAGVPGGPKAHHRVYRGQSGPQDSTPAEKAATERLNQQQLTAVQAPAQPPASPVVGQPQTPPSTPPTQ